MDLWTTWTLTIVFLSRTDVDIGQRNDITTNGEKIVLLREGNYRYSPAPSEGQASSTESPKHKMDVC